MILMKSHLLAFLMLAVILGSLSSSLAFAAPPAGVTICHTPGPSQATLVVSAAAVAAHLAHGDYLGACIPLPPLDTDGDGIPDDEDDCPTLPETVNGYLDSDGCPDTIPIECDEGYELIDEECVLIPIECDYGYEQVGTECVLIELECDEGYEQVGTECVPIEEPIVCEEGFELIGDECVAIPPPDDDDTNDNPVKKKNGRPCRGDCTHPSVVPNGLVINGEAFNVIPYLTEQKIDTELLQLNLISYTLKGKDSVHTALTIGTSTINIDKQLDGSIVVTVNDPDNEMYIERGSMEFKDQTWMNDGTTTITFSFLYIGDGNTLTFVTWDFTRNGLQHTFILE